MARSCTPHLLTLMAALFTIPLFTACTWLYGAAPDGSSKQYEPLVINDFQKWDVDSITRPILLARWSVSATYRAIIAADNKVWQAKADELRNAQSDEERNDFAVSLIYLGKYAESIAILRKLEEETGEKGYAVAANLGTAYELSGNLPEAMKWISEGIARRQDSHFGTEWLHKAILQAKLDGKDSIFDLEDPLDFSRPKTSFTFFDTTYEPKEVLNAIAYQTAERAALVKPTDALMADLFATAGNIAATTRALEPAIDFFELAALYGHPRASQINAWIPQARQTVEHANHIRALKRLAWQGALVVLVMALLGIVLRNILKRYRRPELDQVS